MDLLPYVIVAVAGFFSGLLSGVSGGGGGMIMVPMYIFAGLTPQQAVATGKMNGLGAAFGGLSAFRKSGHIRKDIVRVMIPIAIVIGLITPFIFIRIDPEAFQKIIGIVLLLLVPTLFIGKPSPAPNSKRRGVGYLLYSGVLTLQAIIGSGVGSLSLFVLTGVFGTKKLEANATKRAVTAVLTPITFVALLIGGFVVITYGIVGLIFTFLGTHLGTKVALKKGEEFVKYATACVVALSAVLLIVTA